MGLALAGLALGTALEADDAGETDQPIDLASDTALDLPDWGGRDRERP